MRIRLPIAIIAGSLVIIGCGGNGTVGTNSVPPKGGDMGVPGGGGQGGGGGGGVAGGGGGGGGGPIEGGGGPDMAMAQPGNADLGAGMLGDGGVFVPPAGDMGPVDLGPPITNGNVTTYGKGGDFRDVSTDQGGGIWATSTSTVFYFKGANVYTYDQSNGLSRGQKTWTDTYWFGSPTMPATEPVTFETVAGGMSGQVFVGNIGYTGDRLDVDPSTGAVLDVVGMQVTATQQSNPSELQAQQVREVSSWRAAIDLNGPMSGRAYFGGFHGLSGLSYMTQSTTSHLCGDGCAWYEEHLHPFSSDGSDIFGTDVRAITVTPMGDVWAGDRDAIWWVPQRSLGAGADFFQNPTIPGEPGATHLDVFPNVRDMVFGIAVDGSGGVWVASYGNGLAYLTANTYSPTYWTTANGLPSNYLTGVAVDANGDVWIGTQSSGVARFTPSANSWQPLTTASGLPSNDIRSVRVDTYGDGKTLLFATDNGAAVYHP